MGTEKVTLDANTIAGLFTDKSIAAAEPEKIATTLAIESKCVQVVQGQAGIEKTAWTDDGFFAGLKDLVSRYSDLGEVKDRYIKELEKGGKLVVINLDPQQDEAKLGQELIGLGAQDVHHFSTTSFKKIFADS